MRSFGENLGLKVDISLGRIRAHEGHIVERREEDAAVQSIEVKEALQFEISERCMISRAIRIEKRFASVAVSVIALEPSSCTETD